MEIEEFNQIINLMNSPDPESRFLGTQMFELTDFYRIWRACGFDFPMRLIIEGEKFGLVYKGQEYDPDKLLIMFQEWKSGKSISFKFRKNTYLRDENGKYIKIH